MGTVNSARADAGLDLESVKTQADIWASRTSISRPEPYSISCLAGLNLSSSLIFRSDFDKCGLEVQLLFVDRPRPPMR